MVEYSTVITPHNLRSYEGEAGNTALTMVGPVFQVVAYNYTDNSVTVQSFRGYKDAVDYYERCMTVFGSPDTPMQ